MSIASIRARVAKAAREPIKLKAATDAAGARAVIEKCFSDGKYKIRVQQMHTGNVRVAVKMPAPVNYLNVDFELIGPDRGNASGPELFVVVDVLNSFSDPDFTVENYGDEISKIEEDIQEADISQASDACIRTNEYLY